MIVIRLFFFGLSVNIFFIVLQRNCKLKQILLKKKIDKRIVILVIAM